MGIDAKALVVAGLCVSSFSFAQTHSHTGGHQTADLVEGEVEMVDRRARNITLRHGDINDLQLVRQRRAELAPGAGP